MSQDWKYRDRTVLRLSNGQAILMQATSKPWSPTFHTHQYTRLMTTGEVTSSRRYNSNRVGARKKCPNGSPCFEHITAWPRPP